MTRSLARSRWYPARKTHARRRPDLPVPVVNLRPFSNSLSFDFTFQLLKKRGCEDTTPINMQGAILRDSYLDLRGYPHYAPLPNLEIFANAGFPFTRLADLSETTVVLPAQPTEQEIETFVTLMGHFGRQTGFPALRVTVAGPDALQQGAQHRLHRHRHRRRSARLRQDEQQPAGGCAQRPDPGERHAGILRPASSRLVEAQLR